jgi:8-oxo-dGTP diphosphatase
MRPLDGRFEPSDEVDELRWVPLEEAADLLDYEQDRELIESAASAP